MIKIYNSKKKLFLIVSAILILATAGSAFVYAASVGSEEVVAAESSTNKQNETLDMPSLFPSDEVNKANSLSSDNNTPQDKYALSPNGEMYAEVVREKDMFVDSIVITDKSKKSYKILLENIIYTGISNFTWIDNNRIALCGYVNPSLQVYVVIDADKKEIVGKYNGVGFTWNKNRNKIYYIMTSPYFGDEIISEKIVDNEGNIYYETEKGKSMTDEIAISEDEQTFAFFVNDTQTNDRKMIVTKMEKEKKLKKKAEIATQFGDIEFNGDKILKVKGCDDSVKLYDIVD